MSSMWRQSPSSIRKGGCQFISKHGLNWRCLIRRITFLLGSVSPQYTSPSVTVVLLPSKLTYVFANLSSDYSCSMMLKWDSSYLNSENSRCFLLKWIVSQAPWLNSLLNHIGDLQYVQLLGNTSIWGGFLWRQLLTESTQPKQRSVCTQAQLLPNPKSSEGNSSEIILSLE